MRIQYFSDIHLEFGDCRFPQARSEVTIAAGDISSLNFRDPIDWLGRSSSPVIYVAGNHEYYGGDLIYGAAELHRRAARYPHVHFLECDTVEINGVRFLGATLWTDYQNRNLEIMRSARQEMNDFRTIRYGGRMLMPADLLQIHHATLAWLRFELNKPYAGKTVVVTHHAPSLLSWHRQPGHPSMYAYCSTLSALAEMYPIDLWVHGHTHTQREYLDGKLRVACNARGYFGIEHENDALKPAVAKI